MLFLFGIFGAEKSRYVTDVSKCTENKRKSERDQHFGLLFDNVEAMWVTEDGNQLFSSGFDQYKK